MSACSVRSRERCSGSVALAGPGSLPEEGQARLDAWVAVEAVDAYALAELSPAVDLDEMREHLLEGEAVKRVGGLRGHSPILAPLGGF